MFFIFFQENIVNGKHGLPSLKTAIGSQDPIPGKCTPIAARADTLAHVFCSHTQNLSQVCALAPRQRAIKLPVKKKDKAI